MKNLLLVLIACFSLHANAGMFDTLATSNWPTKPTTKYKIDVYGYDMRVYEWTPKDNPDVRCVFTAGNKNSSGTACYNVRK